MKGIILAGGTGTRMYPMTMAIGKQLLPVYDKPMIYYPLSTLMLAGIRDILVIVTPEERERFEAMLGRGERFGIRISYAVQEEPRGLADAFLIGEEFVGDSACALILGDNIFYGNGLSGVLQKAAETAEQGCAMIFGYYVNDPRQFGVMEFDEKWNVLSVEEKPEYPKSNYCITGLYFYPKGVTKRAKQVKLSPRGELEITSLNALYLQEGQLKAQILGRGYAWRDAGTPDGLLEASMFVQMIEKQQGVQIAALEEIAFRKGWITKEVILLVAEKYGTSAYGQHLQEVADGCYKGR